MDSSTAIIKSGATGKHDGLLHGTDRCLSALLTAGHNEQLLGLLDKRPYKFWSYQQWGVKLLVAQGKKAEALRYAEASLFLPIHRFSL